MATGLQHYKAAGQWRGSARAQTVQPAADLVPDLYAWVDDFAGFVSCRQEVSSLLFSAPPGPSHQMGGALMLFLPRLGRVADFRFSPPEGLPHSALRAGDHQFPYGGVG